MPKEMNFEELKQELGLNGREVNPMGRVDLKAGLAYNLEVRNREQYVKRYKWGTISGRPLPNGIDPEIMERVLYYRYRLIAFKWHDKYYTVPFALTGGIDVYGRYKLVIPLTFFGSINIQENKETGQKTEEAGDGNWPDNTQLSPSYSIYDTAQDTIEGKTYDRCVILEDYTKGISQKDISRNTLSKVLTDELADILVLIKHNLVASARVFTYRVTDEGQKNSSLRELEGMEEGILEDGQMFYPVTSPVSIEQVFDDKELDTQNYWECFVSLDNLRENLMGIENNGIFKKKERELSAEAEKEGSQADLVYQDGLERRQHFCEIFNAVFGEEIWCYESEPIDKVDLNDDSEGGFDNVGSNQSSAE